MEESEEGVGHLFLKGKMGEESNAGQVLPLLTSFPGLSTKILKLPP